MIPSAKPGNSAGNKRMSVIVTENVGKKYGPQTVLSDVSLRLAPDDRIGLVGPNGEGKTTLLRMLAAVEEPTTGRITRRRQLRIGYLPQDPPPLGDTTLWQSMLSVFADLRRMEDELHELSGKLHVADSGKAMERLGRLQIEFETAGGYTYETRIKSTLGGLGFGAEEYGRPLSQMSGGQQNRALLAAVLLSEPDLLLLDEPTNHLDLAATEWLEKWVLGFKGAILVVSHDRYLLDRVTQKTWEISFGALVEYRGNYTAYLTQREARFEERTRIWELQQEHIRKTEEFIRRTHAALKAKQAKSRRVLLDRFLKKEAIARPKTPQQINVRLRPSSQTGNFVLRTSGLTIGYDAQKPLLKPSDLTVERGNRVAIIGPNGSGKTCLLRTLLGDLEPLGGVVSLGANVDMGYLPQTHVTLDPQKNVIDTLRDTAPDMTPQQARTLLGSFLFHGDDPFKLIGELSGGQRSRVILAQLVVRGANVLMLDEPTNHLDIPSQEILQDVLQDFAGTVVFVTHDRYLVQALATHIWLVEDESICVVRGGWDQLLRWREQRAAPAGDIASAQGETPAPPPSRGQNEYERRKEQKRLLRRQEKIEKEIGALEARLRELSQMIESADWRIEGQAQRVREIGEEYQSVSAQLQAKWNEYSSVLESLDSGQPPSAS